MLLQSLILIIVYFVVWFIIAAIIKNAGIIDIGWGLGFVVVAWFGFLQNAFQRSLLLVIPITIWGLRLTYHIFKRNVGKPEDYRYAKFRKDWGKNYYATSFFKVFMFQAIMMFIISSAFIYGIQSKEIVSNVLVLSGLIIWIFGFVFEAVSDKQLKSFISNKENKGKIIKTGLWKYSRHPYYFGEAVIWWGVFLISIGFGAPWYTIFSPVMITLLLRFVTGVPLIEKRNANKPGYAEYVEKTNVFFPCFVKKGVKGE